MFVLKVPSRNCFRARLWCQTHFGIKATLTTTIVRFGKKTKTNQDALSQDILTRDFNLTCLKAKNLKIEPFVKSFRPVSRMSDGFTGRMVSLMRPLTFVPAVCKK